MKLSARINSIKPSPTLAITMKANALRAEGRDVIGFGAGEPDFDTPDNVKKAAIQAIEEGFTKYTPVGGIDELKDAIIGKLNRDNKLNYTRAQIVVSCGAKHTLYNLAQVLFEEGDEVIIPSPYWVSYPDIVILTGAKACHSENKRIRWIQDRTGSTGGSHQSPNQGRHHQQPLQPHGCGLYSGGTGRTGGSLCSEGCVGHIGRHLRKNSL